jgi:acetyl esterase
MPQDVAPMADVADRWVAARGRRILCRVYRPVVAERLPVIVYAHGGGWYFSSVDTHDALARLYAAEGRAVLVSVDYALSPEVKFPHALEEIAAVVAQLPALEREWNIDASRLVLAGDSAGGALALGCALLMRDRGLPRPRGVLAAYPVCDADFTTESYREFATGLPLTAEKMRFFWRHYVRDATDMLHPLAAPLRADLRDLPPALIHVAELDVLRSEAVALGERLRAAGVPVELEVFAGLTHGFMRSADRVSAAREAGRKAGRWLRAVLAQTA